MQTFTIKRNDTGPRLLFALTPADEIDLTGATVRFSMRSRAGVLVVNRVVAVIITETGTPTVAYDWQPADTATAGVYEAEFEVTYSGAAVETFPNNGYISIIVADDIA